LTAEPIDLEALADAVLDRREQRERQRALAAQARAELAGELEPVLAAERERADAARAELAELVGPSGA
jgi:hypothetical protein